MSNITTVFFDVGNTLLTPARPEADVFVEAAKSLEINLDRQLVHDNVPEMYLYYEELYRQDESFWADDRRAVAIWLQMYEYLCELMAIDERYRKEIASRVYQYYLLPEAWTTFPDVLPTLEQLCERGLRLGLISNWDTSLSSVIAGMNLGHLFTDIIASADVMLHKPQPEIFQLALKRMNAQPTQAMHIGDHASADVAGASAAGITAIYLNREGKKLDGNLSISALAELPQLV